MAINIKNYVDISTKFPNAGVAERAFGGLVITAKEMNPQTDEKWQKKKAEYDAGDIIRLSLDEVKTLFGGREGDVYLSDEYRFAEGYYSYTSPSGRFASLLAFAKITRGERSGDDTLTKVLVNTFKDINDATNQFGSFTFLSVPSDGNSLGSLDEDEKDALVAVAKENAALDAKYLFVVNCPRGEDEDSEKVTKKAAAFVDDDGNPLEGVCFVSGSSDVSAYMPMAIFAATDYNDGQVTNFMFKQFDTEEPNVRSDADYTAFNTAEYPVNFYGQTQTNGQTLSFFQRGFNTDGTDTAIYCNEIWFKSACETALMQLLLGRERLPADALGVDLVKLEVVGCCADGISNGMFMAKTPTTEDLKNIREIVTRTGGDSQQVDAIEVDVTTKGYSVYAYLDQAKQNVNNSDAVTLGGKLGKSGEKYIVYYVFYGTADSVRYIKGNDILLK